MFVATLAVATALVLALPLVRTVRHSWLNTPQPDSQDGERTFRFWTLKALALPLFLWCGWNAVALLGPDWGWLPLLPRARGSALAAYLLGTGWALFWSVLVWTGFTLAWLLPRLSAAIRNRDEFGALAWLVGVVGVLLLAGAAFLRSWGLALLITSGALAVLFHWSVPLIHRASPTYSRAIGRMKRGHYAEAEEEVIRQLEEKADDYQGWMMLAQLYAEKFGELGEADQTVRDLCDQPGLPPLQVALAFSQLSEWHLKLGSNPTAARAALTEILRRCPGTPFARTAENRLRQLPVDEAELRERRQPRVIRLGALHEGEIDPPPATDQLDARTEAEALTKRLQARPDDLPTRLRLARVLAERLGQIEAAQAHLKSVRDSPEATPGQLAESLAMEAAWQLRLKHDPAAARLLLERLIAAHPSSAQALAARRQLEILDRPETVPAAEADPPPPPRRIVVRLPPPGGSTNP